MDLKYYALNAAWEKSIVSWLVALIVSGQTIQAQSVPGMLGGQTYDGVDYYGYAGSLTQGLEPINVLGNSLPGGIIYNVSMSATGAALIGGKDGSNDAYAAMLFSNGQLVSLLPASQPGRIGSTAMNQLGNGAMSGSVNSVAYLARVSANGAVTPITLPTDVSATYGTQVVINDSGKMAMTAETTPTGNNWLAVIDANDQLTEISIDGNGGAAIAMNNAGLVLVGIMNSTSSNLEAYFLDANNTTQSITLPTSGSGLINWVGINNLGTGLMVGSLGNNGYATFVTSPNSVIEITETAFAEATLTSCAINDANMGLIAGETNSGTPLVFSVNLDGSIIPLAVSPTVQINDVAINQMGIGLIGGFIKETSGNYLDYAALVAPNNTLTPLTIASSPDPSGRAGIFFTALADTTPTAVGSYASAINSQLSVAAALETHFHQTSFNAARSQQPIALTASSDLSCTIASQQQSPKNVLWAVPIFNYVHIQSQGNVPTYANTIGGLLVGYDRSIDQLLVGAGFGYAYNYAAYSQNIGHSKINEELGCLYAIYSIDHFRVNGALWGGGYQLHTERHTISTITSNSHAHGWILSPHLELAFPFAMGDKARVEPFAMFDWVNNWQSGFTETGSAGFNLVMGSLYNSLLQSELGLRFYEQVASKNGLFTFEQKLCYVNQAPFNVNNTNVFFCRRCSCGISCGHGKFERAKSRRSSAIWILFSKRYPLSLCRSDGRGYAGNILSILFCEL